MRTTALQNDGPEEEHLYYGGILKQEKTRCLALHTTALQDDGPEDIQSVHARSRGQMVEDGFLQHLDNLHSLKMLLAYTFKKCCYVTCHAQGRWVLPC